MPAINDQAGRVAQVTEDGRLMVTEIGGAVVGVQNEGVPMPVRNNLNFVGAGVDVLDSAPNGRTDIVIPGGGGGGGGVDLVNVTRGAAKVGEYFSPVPSSAGSFAFSFGDARWSPILVPVPMTVDIGCHVETGVAASVVRIILCSDTGLGVPGAVLVQATVGGDTSGLKSITGILLTAGMYWATAVNQNAAALTVLTYCGLSAGQVIQGTPITGESQSAAWASNTPGICPDPPVMTGRIDSPVRMQMKRTA